MPSSRGLRAMDDLARAIAARFRPSARALVAAEDQPDEALAKFNGAASLRGAKPYAYLHRDGRDLPAWLCAPRTALVSFVMPSLRVYRATDDLAREMAGRIKRLGMVLLGLAIIVAGVLIAPLPGPGGIPVIVIGLMVVLRHSFKARRQFVRLARAHPRVLSPIRQLLRRDPEYVAIFYHQHLRVERILLPPRLRMTAKVRRRFFRRRRR